MLIRKTDVPQVFEIITQDDGERKTLENIVRDLPISTMAVLALETARFIRLTNGANPEDAEYMIVPSKLIKHIIGSKQEDKNKLQRIQDKLGATLQRAQDNIVSLQNQASYATDEQKKKIVFNKAALTRDALLAKHKSAELKPKVDLVEEQEESTEKIIPTKDGENGDTLAE